jgi:Pyruvate carboxylase
MTLISISPLQESGACIVRYVLDSEMLSYEIQMGSPTASGAKGAPKADPNDPYQIGAPSSGDLWIMYVHPGDIVKKGDELFNVSIMKQEKSVLAPIDGIVKRVLKSADYRGNRKMVPVKEGEFLVELAPVPLTCSNPACGKPVVMDNAKFCPHCGSSIG